LLPAFLLGIAILVGMILIARWYVSAEPKAVLKVLRWVGLGLVAAVVLFFAVTGRLGWALGAAVVLLPWALRIMRTVRTARSFARMATGASGRTSNVETRFLRMSLDHDTGELDGEIVEGPHAGRRLGTLTPTELTALLDLCRDEDQQSAQILEAYLDRVHPDWRDMDADQASRGDRGGQGVRGGEGAMTREEAYRVLGLEPGASETEIKSAYHRLIAGLHPDKGGSTFLAAKVNQAKEVLLGR
jgi:DnaJ-domain-containing protein 1